MRLSASALGAGFGTALVVVMVIGARVVHHAGAPKSCIRWATGTIDSVGIDGSGHRTLTHDEDALDSMPRFAPDGTLVFTRNALPDTSPLTRDYFLRDGKPDQVDDIIRDEREPHPYPPIPTTSASPEGRYRFERTDSTQTYSNVLVDTRTARRVTPHGNGIRMMSTQAVWSPRGDAALVSGFNEDAGGVQGGQLYLVDLPSGEAHLLVPGGFWQRDFQFSPDGNTIVFSNLTDHEICHEVPSD